MARDPGSFRDPSSQVVIDGDRVLRLLDERGHDAWKTLAATDFFEDLVRRGWLVGTRPAELPTGHGDHWVAALEHDRIPFVSYPYEWSFSMLRQAALLTLDILEAALAEDMILKDATPFNVQWFGGRPVFIDVGSFEPLETGDAWIGYRQFCRQFLYPLMLTAYKDIPFRPWLRGRLDGISAVEFRRMLRPRDLLRKGVLLHVSLQARAEQRYAATVRNVRDEMKQAGFSKDLIINNVRGLRKVVERLVSPARDTEWTDYAGQDHVVRQRSQKADFLRDVVDALQPDLVWDLGANDGHFSRIAAEAGAYVVAADADEGTSDRLFRALYEEGNRSILPLVMDVTDPSPATGWRARERTPLEARGVPDLIVMNAVIHHMVIGGNVPMREVVRWLSDLGAEVVIEFVPVGDPMTDRLLANKRLAEIHRDYTEEAFRALALASFEIVNESAVGDSTRRLFHLRPAG